MANERAHSLRIPEWLRTLNYQPREFWSQTAVILAVYQQLVTQPMWERGVWEGVFGQLLCFSPFLSLCPVKLPVGTQTGKYLSLRNCGSGQGLRRTVTLPVPEKAGEGLHRTLPWASGIRAHPLLGESRASFPDTEIEGTRPYIVSDLREGAALSGGDQRGLLCFAVATSASPARGAALKRAGEAAPCRPAPSAASRPGTRSAACRPHPTSESGVPTTCIPRGESIHLPP